MLMSVAQAEAARAAGAAADVGKGVGGGDGWDDFDLGDASKEPAVACGSAILLIGLQHLKEQLAREFNSA